MSLMRVFNIAGSGMTAQSVRLNTTASNLANANSVESSEDKVYKARYPVFSTQFNDTLNQVYETSPEAVSVKVDGVVESDRPLIVDYQPQHPKANADGYIYRTNVNTMESMAEMIEASREFQTNVEMLETVKTMIQKALSLANA